MSVGGHMITLPKSGGCIVTPDVSAMAQWERSAAEKKQKMLNRQVIGQIEPERRDALREHGDDVLSQPLIANRGIGQ